MLVQICGRVQREDDPMYDRHNDRIIKVIPVAAVSEVVEKWLNRGRKIEAIFER
jgi:hypothetical protein